MNDLSRDDVNALSTQVRLILLSHRAGEIETERARDVIEQMVAGAAGQLGERDRRLIAHFAERLIGAVWSDSLSIDAACIKVERLAAAAAAHSFEFRRLGKEWTSSGDARC